MVGDSMKKKYFFMFFVLIILVSILTIITATYSDDEVIANLVDTDQNERIVKIMQTSGIIIVNATFLLTEKSLDIPDKDRETLTHYAGKFEVNCEEKSICEIYDDNTRDHCTDFASYEIIYKYACLYLEKAARN
jgi:hypothetical protein